MLISEGQDERKGGEMRRRQGGRDRMKKKKVGDVGVDKRFGISWMKERQESFE